jgi:hypothetical protein
MGPRHDKTVIIKRDHRDHEPLLTLRRSPIQIKMKLGQELQEAGYDLDWNKVMRSRS